MSANLITKKYKIRLDEFAFRQFDDKTYLGTQVNYDKDAFMQALEDLLNKDDSIQLADGYAPFCKHIFVPNFVSGVKVGSLPITDANKHLVESSYVARTEKELPVLVRYFPKGKIEIPDATYLDLILYSKDQIDKESAAMNNTAFQGDYEWGLISVKGQLETFELPMTPITILRNALGKEEGGSGVPLDRAKYLESVAYWQNNASIA